MSCRSCSRLPPALRTLPCFSTSLPRCAASKAQLSAFWPPALDTPSSSAAAMLSVLSGSRQLLVVSRPYLQLSQASCHLSVTPEHRVWHSLIRAQVQAGAERQRKKLLSSASIVGLTCCSAALPALDDQAFDITVLDEGSQITEPLALVPLTRAKSRHASLSPRLTQSDVSPLGQHDAEDRREFL